MRPDFIIIGAKKSGTTSLHRYLDIHPEIAMAEPRELDFFLGRGSRWDKGTTWYESRFDPRARVRGETSPIYTAYPFVRGVPERIHSMVPNAKLLYLVRDPVERIISAYGHRWANGYEDRPIATVVSDHRFPSSGYVVQSRYWMQIERFLEYFDPSHVLVVAQEDLLMHRQSTLSRIFRFVGADGSFWSTRFARVHNLARDRRVPPRIDRWSRRLRLRRPLHKAMHARGLGVLFTRPMPRPELAPDVRNHLASLVAADAELLRRFTGQRFERWSV